MERRRSYKIVVCPTTFKLLLRETSWETTKSGIPAGTGIHKRGIAPGELSYWYESDFREKLEEAGYGHCVDDYIKQEEAMFKIDECLK